MPVDQDEILALKGLVKTYRLGGGFFGRNARSAARVVALDGVSLQVHECESMGIVGESGSGKSTIARTIVRLIEPDEGTVEFRGRDLFSLSTHDAKVTTRRIQMIYQDPYSSLNPLLSVGSAIVEPARVHGFVDRRGADEEARRLLDRVHLPARAAEKRPRELSGGQRQRVSIARALAARPEVLIADEAVSALDVSIQAEILNLFADIKEELALTLIFIAHQLSVVANVAERVAVMYLGRIVEIGPTQEMFFRSAHPYTLGLLDAQPGRHRKDRTQEPALTGEVPSAVDIPSGCRFRTRCAFAEPICEAVDPPPVLVSQEHYSWCHVLPRKGTVDSRQDIASSEPSSIRLESQESWLA